MRNGDTEQAVQHYSAAHEMAPEDGYIRMCLEEARAAMG